MQELVYKLVPGVQIREEENQLVFLRTVKAEPGENGSAAKLSTDKNAVISVFWKDWENLNYLGVLFAK